MFSSALLLLGTVATVFAQDYTYSCEAGKDVMVQLFEWKWDDVGTECANLAAAGYCSVQVSPPQEHALYASDNFPWWQRYHAVSYLLTSRSGDRQQFSNMVTACNAAGVRVYVDFVMNHMTSSGEGFGSGGTYWNAGAIGGQDYPGPGYLAEQFHDSGECPTTTLDIEDFNNIIQVRNCRKGGQRDLDQKDAAVVAQLTGYLTDLESLGVAGVQVESSEFMLPEDISSIVGGATGFVYQHINVYDPADVIQPDEYIGFRRVTEFRYAKYLGECVNNMNGRNLAQLEFITDGLVPSDAAVVFVDNHETQRYDDGIIVTYQNRRNYVAANAFMLAYGYGYPRIMSSYAFSAGNGSEGPPSNGDGFTNDVACGAGWICEHQWTEIQDMITYHNNLVGEPVNDFQTNGESGIAFGRGGRFFFMMNLGATEWTDSLQTGLPQDDYCDLLTCDSLTVPCGGANCRGNINVIGNGNADITLPAGEALPYYIFMSS